jgi:hypothetical protein
MAISSGTTTLVTQNALVKAADGLYRMWFTTQPLDYWPMTNSSFWLGGACWGMHASGYHVTNLLLHVGSALLLWAILRRLSIPGAWLAAFLFALHPVNVESVAWIAQRKNTLSMVFFLLSVWWYCPFRGETQVVRSEAAPDDERPPDAGRQRRTTNDSVGIGSASPRSYLAMLSKGSVAFLPPMLLLLAWWRQGTVQRTDVWRAAPFLSSPWR